MRNFLMGVAAVALAAGSASAQPGNGNGNDKQGGRAQASAGGSQKGNGGGNGKSAPTRLAQNGNGNGGGSAKSNGGGQGNAKAAVQREVKAERGNGNGNGNGKAKASENRGNVKVARDNGNSGMKANGNGKSDYAKGNSRADRGDREVVRYNGREYVRDDRFSYSSRDDLARSYGLIDGCPPGLAKKNNGCNPPGLVKRDDYDYDRSNWWGLPGLVDGRYRYYDNNLVRISDAGRILGYYPLLGGALSSGNVWPTWFDYQPVPSYYESYYGLGPVGSYRYADNVLYRVDPETAAITSIAALLTGDSFNIGQPMPSGYSVYNVPYGYRDRYYDTPDMMYRYSDGYVYGIDPTTMLVASAIEMVL